MESPPSSAIDKLSDETSPSIEDVDSSHETSGPLSGPRLLHRLCDRCYQHGFTYDSFVVCDEGLGSQFDGSHHRSTVSLRTGGPDIQLQSFEKISEHSAVCNFCSLIVRAIRKYSPHVLDNGSRIACSLHWDVDGQQEIDPETFRKQTRRLRLMWQAGEERHNAFLVLVTRADPSATSPDLNRDRRPGRELKPEDGKQALIKSWLDICRKEHKNSCGIATQKAEFYRLVDETYFGVIDVTDLQLKALPKSMSGRPAKFVALSYVWGSQRKDDKPYITTRRNVPYRRAHGGLEKDLKNFPLVVQNAIKLVQQMRLRYLWVDTICIVQDSYSSIGLNAADVHIIYGNAHFTICAADGKDGHTGLLALATEPHIRAESRDSEQITPNVRLRIARPLEMVIRDSVWDSRGWKFQERILSRRCVIFAGGRVYFQCRKTAFSEDVHEDANGSGWSLLTTGFGSPSRYFVDIEKRSFAFYMRCVSMFYKRQLTHPKDILAAFEGIQSIMEMVMSSPFCYGLPTSHFDLALLWQPSQALRRRVAREGTHNPDCSSFQDKKCTCEPTGRMDLGRMEFPSWSWCGWIGGEVEYNANTLSGALLSVREWLSHQTWIKWHIVDGRGQLRPLWNRHDAAEDCSLEVRWRGYMGRPVPSISVQSDSSGSSSDENIAHTPQNGVRTDNERHEMTSMRKRHRRVPEPGYEFLQRVPARKMRMKAWKEDLSRTTAANHCLTKPRERVAESESSNKYRSQHQEAHIDRSVEPESIMKKCAEEVVSAEAPTGPTSSRPTRAGFGDHMQDFRSDIDDWGRKVDGLPTDDHYTANIFNVAHSDHPYSVKVRKWSQRLSEDLSILRFWTMLRTLRVVFHERIPGSGPEGQGLSRCWIADAADDWCGSIVLNDDWIDVHGGEMVNFIALSNAKAFANEEKPEWSYYPPREQSESEWEIVYALLIVDNQDKHVWERVGLGKIFKAAFTGDCWQEIMLG